jgi:uncharacterized membrane-anchored protein YitT (DUF2179 family)
MFESNYFLFAHLAIPFCCFGYLRMGAFTGALACAIIMNISSCIRLWGHDSRIHQDPFRQCMSLITAVAWALPFYYYTYHIWHFLNTIEPVGFWMDAVSWGNVVSLVHHGSQYHSQCKPRRSVYRLCTL